MRNMHKLTYQIYLVADRLRQALWENDLKNNL